MAEASSASSSTGLKPTLGLTGLTANAAALIAPGAFLWLTFAEQSTYGAPAAAVAMWFGMFMAFALCLATAYSYGELSKLYPGAGSSYFFAEQAFLSKKKAYKWARLFKFMVGWASHLYYWVYPGVMVCVTALFCGYMAGFLNLYSGSPTFNSTIGSPPLMVAVCVLFAILVCYIAFRGIVGSTGVNVFVNVLQIVALIIFACMAIVHRVHVHEGDLDVNLLNSGLASPYVQDSFTPTGATASQPKVYDKGDGSPVLVYFVANSDGSLVQPSSSPDYPAAIKVDPTGKSYVADTADTPVPVPTDNDGNPTDPRWTLDPATGYLVFKGGPDTTQPATTPATQPATQPTTLPVGTIAKPQWNTTSYKGGFTNLTNGSPDPKGTLTFNYHGSAASVVQPHGFSFVIVQMGMAILCLVGFESVSSMGEEAKNPKKHIPIAILLSLLIQGGFCYLLEYFAANYYQSSSFMNTSESSSAAPIGDMMQCVGMWAFGSQKAGWWFVIVEGITVFLALVGTTLSCVNTGARVTYAMGRDEEVPNHFGLLHGKNNTPSKCIWTLAVISIVIGIFGIAMYVCGPAAAGFTDGTLSDAQKGSMWYLGAFKSPTTAAKFPNSLLIITLVSNFGTFMLYMMTCIVAMVAFHEHKMYNPIKHILIPGFGLLANLLCMLFYLVGPFMIPGMSKKEPYIALTVAAIWGVYGAIYFIMRNKKAGRAVLITQPPEASPA